MSKLSRRITVNMCAKKNINKTLKRIRFLSNVILKNDYHDIYSILNSLKNKNVIIRSELVHHENIWGDKWPAKILDYTIIKKTKDIGFYVEFKVRYHEDGTIGHLNLKHILDPLAQNVIPRHLGKKKKETFTDKFNDFHLANRNSMMASLVSMYCDPNSKIIVLDDKDCRSSIAIHNAGFVPIAITRNSLDAIYIASMGFKVINESLGNFKGLPTEMIYKLYDLENTQAAYFDFMCTTHTMPPEMLKLECLPNLKLFVITFSKRGQMPTEAMKWHPGRIAWKRISVYETLERNMITMFFLRT
jgi:hypothetical protein